MTFQTPDRTTLKFVGNECWLPIPAPMESVLASLWAKDVGNIILKLPFTANEYANGIPNKLPGLPPNKEVESSINFLPGTSPIFPPSYQMAPA